MSAYTEDWGGAHFQSEGLGYLVHVRLVRTSERGNSQAAGFQNVSLIILCSPHPVGLTAGHSAHLDISLLFN